MISLRDVVTGFGNRDPLAEVWRRDLRGGGSSAEITGTLPLSFSGRGKPLTDYLISGNTLQNGTPTPEAPVDVMGCGVRTENLFDVDAFATTAQTSKCAVTATDGSLVISNASGDAFVGAAYASGNILPAYLRPGAIKVQPSTAYVIKTKFPKCFYSFFDEDFVCLNDVVKQFIPTESIVTKSVITPANCRYVYLRFGYRFSNEETAGTYTFPSIIFNLGSTALPYEPYGYKLPLTVNDTEYPIYLGQVPTTRRIKKVVLNGTEQGWGKNIGLTNSNAFSIAMSNWVGNRKIGYCTHYQNVTDAQAAEGIFFGNSLNILTALADGLDDVTKFEQYLSDQYAAGTPVTIWYVLATPEIGIVNEPLHKIGGYADTISFAQAGVTIPTVNGANVLDMTATVKPSEVYIKGKGIKPTGYGQLVDNNSVRILDKNNVRILVHGK